MCEKKSCCCTNPEKLENEPKDCTPEQIAECHPCPEEHPCVDKQQEAKSNQEKGSRNYRE